MIRRRFIGVSALAVPALAAGVVSCKNKVMPENVHSDIASENADPLIQKAMMAMLSMQRMAWEQGTASQALIAIGKKDLAILFAKNALVRQTNDGRLGIVNNDIGATDPASNGEAVMLAWHETGDQQYKQAADHMLDYLMNQAPKTKDGILHHFISIKQVWSDSSFMAPPFIALMGNYDESVRQIEGFRKYLMNPEKKLYYHIWDEDKNDFDQKVYWGGGNGWTAAAIAKIINLLPEEREDLRSKMVLYGKEVIDGCIVYMRPDGLFHDIIDDSHSFVETNLSQMLAFAIYTGIKAGWLDDSYKAQADKMRAGARCKIDSYGIVQDACGSPFFDKAGTSTEAQAFFLMMESAYDGLKS